jgi:XTP/dITP diphosphohydrolase
MNKKLLIKLHRNQKIQFFNDKTKDPMLMKKTIMYATSNTSKFEEIKRFATKQSPQDIQVEQLQINFSEIQSLSQEKVTLNKVRQAWNQIKKPVIAEDAGIFFEKYTDFPGTMTKLLIASIGWEGIAEFSKLSGEKITHSICMSYKDSEESEVTFSATTQGKLKIQETSPPKEASMDLTGMRGYIYFIPKGETQTLAQMLGDPEKEHYFYRIQAFKKFIDWNSKNR